MQRRQFHIDTVAFRWTVFGVLFAAVAIGAVRGVLGRAQEMKAADTSASALASVAPGSPAKAVVRLDHVAGIELKGTLLQRQSDTVYLIPSENTSTVTAILTPETSVVMGKPEEIAAGAIVQLDGTMDEHHALHTNQIAILTGYVRLSKGQR